VDKEEPAKQKTIKICNGFIAKNIYIFLGWCLFRFEIVVLVQILIFGHVFYIIAGVKKEVMMRFIISKYKKKPMFIFNLREQVEGIT